MKPILYLQWNICNLIPPSLHTSLSLFLAVGTISSSDIGEYCSPTSLVLSNIPTLLKQLNT